MLPQHVFALDGKHFKTLGQNPQAFSWKLQKSARNGIFMVNRANGKIDYMSINHYARKHDIKAFTDSTLIQDEFVRHTFFKNYTIIADLGFKSQKVFGVYTPGYSEEEKNWEQLTEEEKLASYKIRQSQKNIENTFARIFRNAYKLCEQLIGNDRKSTRQSSIIHASVLLHNLTINLTQNCIFDDNYSRLQKSISI